MGCTGRSFLWTFFLSATSKHSGHEQLKAFVTFPKDKPSADLPQEMKTIIYAALELDEMLMNSKAIFTVRRSGSDGSKNQRFDAYRKDAFIQGKDLSLKTVAKFAISHAHQDGQRR